MRATVNEKYEFDLSDSLTYDIAKNQDGEYHMIYKNQSYRIIPEDYNSSTKLLSLTIEGRMFTVQLEDKFDQLIEKLGFSLNITPVFKDIKAPMPGLVLKVMVGTGDSVSEGDALLILEAMKMENIIKAPGDGVVKNVLVKAKDAIEKGTVLIEME